MLLLLLLLMLLLLLLLPNMAMPMPMPVRHILKYINMPGSMKLYATPIVSCSRRGVAYHLRRHDRGVAYHFCRHDRGVAYISVYR